MVMVPFRPESSPDDVGDGVGGVDDQVEDDLIEFAGQAEDAGQAGLEVLDDGGDIFPFVGGDDERVFHRLVEVHRDFFAAAGMGEIAHGADDAGDVVEPFQGLLDGAGRLGQEEIQVALREGLFQLGDQGGGGRRFLDGVEEELVPAEQGNERAKDFCRKRMLSPMYWVGVLISWAMPAARWPTDSSFWAWRSWISIMRRSCSACFCSFLGFLELGDIVLEGLVGLLQFGGALGDEFCRRSRWLWAWLKRFHFSARA